ncbi:parallel beta-helix repeat (two copies) [Thermanaeromonas toyohensis ToBE]|uniref:Parallel beta-helix repeat (Two copies) n=1 Tax=Thermanaeromonas toyohensis ToBE TaxID=698762 RepID=A0A1W1VZI9_9FIRM|nr:S-layer homology domain-containing protein [Thermanaeromonas toyohensis]SMB98670.1 parallel beta-helix repeat (two copies) [Thermanaeromonas toyohensis ToBE]
MQKLFQGILAVLVGWSLALIVGGTGTQAVAEVTYAVYNETQGRYFNTLQEALDTAQSGDFIKVVEPGREFRDEILELKVNLILDLNGARVRAPWNQNALTVTSQVYNATIRNGSLSVSSVNASGIYAPGVGASYPLQLRLENMVIEGNASVKFERDGKLEWHSGEARGLNYGVLVAYTVQDFTGVFSSVTFERHTKGGIYFSGLSSNHPSTYFEFHSCQWGKPDNPLSGPALWIEAGTTFVSIQGGSIEASQEGLPLIKISANGEVNINTTSFHRGDRTALDVQTGTVKLRENFISRGAYTGSPSPNIPAITIKTFPLSTPVYIELKNNQIKGPGDLGLSFISTGDVVMQNNILEGFATGIHVNQAQRITAEQNSVVSTSQGIVVESVSSGNLRNNTIRRPLEITGGVASGVLILRSQSLNIEGLMVEGWPIGLKVSESEGVNITTSAFRNNTTGVLLTGSRGSTLSGSLWENNGTGLLVTQSTQVNLEDNIFTRNTIGADINATLEFLFSRCAWQENDTGVRMAGEIEGVITGGLLTANNTSLDLEGITQAQVDLSRNDIFNNTTGVKAQSELELTAPLNFWGSSNGPYHPDLNPEGHGEPIIGKIFFSPWAVYAYYLDGRPPQLTLTYPAEKWLTRDPLTLQVAVYEETWLDKATLAVYGPSEEKVMERIWWGKEGRHLQENLVWETAEMPDGWYILVLEAKDGKGNTNRLEGRLLLDRQPPSNLQVLINGGAIETSQLTVELRFQGEDTSGIKEISISNEGGPVGPWEPFSKVKTWELLPGPPGERRVIVIFRDGAGWEAEAKATIVYKPNEGQQGLTESSESGNGTTNYSLKNENKDNNRPLPKKRGDDFKDVPSTHWAYPAITVLFQRGLIYGRGEGLFAPEEVITRAEFAALLDRVLKLPGEGQIRWPDVPPGVWYAGPIGHLTKVGIMGGYQDGTFRPLNGVTREEAALILFRSLGGAGEGERVVAHSEVSRTEGNLTEGGQDKEQQGDIYSLKVFIDGQSVSPWAVKGVQWAVVQGLLRGYPGGLLRPKALLTRAEAAALIHRFWGLLESMFS